MLKNKYDATAILSYHKIIPAKFLKFSKYNLVVHESDLPKGRGFSPLYRQIISGHKNITFNLFECSEKMDEGKIYLKKKFYFSPTLIYNEIKARQLSCAKELIYWFICMIKKKKVKNFPQKGKASYFKRMSLKDRKININKSISSQFNILRTKDNNNFPSYFIYKKTKYYLKLFVK